MAVFVPVIFVGSHHAHGPLSLEYTMGFAVAFALAMLVVWLVWKRRA
ncbi:MAG TPA: hypothetical protein VJ798_06620 [Rhizomicrobium sp.]|nr:hypothetical protein [Rhizomicrobium sp.]